MNNDQWIAREKEDIMEKLQGTRLFGEQIDLCDRDMVIVAAYHLGRLEEIQHNLKNWQIMRQLL